MEAMIAPTPRMSLYQYTKKFKKKKKMYLSPSTTVLKYGEIFQLM